MTKLPSIVIACAALTACGHHDAAPAAHRDARARMAAADAALAPDARVIDASPPPADAVDEADGDPIKAVVIEAFGGHLPVLPALSADGTHAAIDVSQFEGLSSIHDYAVGILDTRSVFGERLEVLALKLGEQLLQEPPPPLPKQRLADSAKKVTQRLTGFSEFAMSFDHDDLEKANGSLALGDTKLTFTTAPNGLALRWVDKDGKLWKSELVRAIPRSPREGGRCGGNPRLIGLRWDAPRRRALLQIIYPGSDSCADEPTQWRLW